MRIRSALAVLLVFLSLAPAALGQQVVTAGIGVRNPAVAVAGTGDFVAVWNDVDDGVAGFGVFARLFDKSGKPKGRAFRVHDDLFGDQLDPKVAADERGNFVVVWQGPDGSASGVTVQRFDRNGNRLGRAMRANRSVAGIQVFPDVAMEADGSFLVAWTECQRPSHCPGLRVGRFSAGGKRRGQELEIPVRAEGGSIPPQPLIVIEPAGFAVGWTERLVGHQFQDSDVRIRRFTASGLPAGEPFDLDNVRSAEGSPGWSLAALVTDRAGSSAAFFDGLRSSFQLFGPEGEPAGPRKVISRRDPCPGTLCDEHIGTAAMASDGRFAVVWRRRTSTGGPFARHSLLVQFYDPAGLPLGERFEVASSPRFIFEAAAAFDAEGTLVLTWTDQSTDDVSRSPFRLLVRQIRPR